MTDTIVLVMAVCSGVIPAAAYIVSIGVFTHVNTKNIARLEGRIDRLEGSIDARFNKMQDYVDARLNKMQEYVEVRLNKMQEYVDAQLSKIQMYVEARFNRLEAAFNRDHDLLIRLDEKVDEMRDERPGAGRTVA